MARVMTRRKPNDKVLWVHDTEQYGNHLISFDGVKVFNLFIDYPHNLTKEQKELFDKENPFWAEFLSDEE